MTHSAHHSARKRKGSPHAGRSLAAFALAVGVVVLAAPSEWSGLFDNGSAQAETPEPMGYEIAGESFPGSAFYYLEPVPYQPVSDADDTTAEETGDTKAGPAAQPLVASGDNLTKARALQCMTMAIYYEAGAESDAGQRAVAQVVLNRVAHPSYPNSVCGVVFQGSQRQTGCQFSFTCDGSLKREPSVEFWRRARTAANAALSGAVYAPVGLATHYHTLAIHPYWADSLQTVGTVGAHRFYRWQGAAGRPAAFTARYAAKEPRPGSIEASGQGSAPVDPVQLARQYEVTHPAAAAQGQADAAATQATTPVDTSIAGSAAQSDTATGNTLPGSGAVKPEYARSGEWIERP